MWGGEPSVSLAASVETESENNRQRHPRNESHLAAVPAQLVSALLMGSASVGSLYRIQGSPGNPGPWSPVNLGLPEVVRGDRFPFFKSLQYAFTLKTTSPLA